MQRLFKEKRREKSCERVNLVRGGRERARRRGSWDKEASGKNERENERGCSKCAHYSTRGRFAGDNAQQ